MNKLLKNYKVRVILDIYMPCFLWFTFVFLLQLNFFGIYIIVPIMAFYDTIIMDRKGFTKNLAINIITMVTFVLLYEYATKHINESLLADLSTFIFGFYSAFFSYIIAGEIAKVRIDKQEYL